MKPGQPPKTPDEALELLRAGNRRFHERKPYVRSTDEIERLWTELASGQAPFAIILGCSDSRLSPEIIFDQFFGSLFVVREAGNVAVSPTNIGSLEFGQAVLGAKLLLVFGHSSCGAVTAAFDRAQPGGNIQAIVDAIAPFIATAATLDDAIVANVRGVQAQIRQRSALLRAAEDAGNLKIAGAVYDIRSGVVTFLDA
ncbi:MAG TPA: carbonic anhydrase [Candidatus Binatia bacterium]|nr:carbonic anhydrase [Candidatus Binatia bacterium]